MNWRSHHLAAVLVVLALAPIPLFTSRGAYLSRIFLLIVIFATMAIAVNIAFGHVDQLLLFSGGIAGLSSYFTILVAGGLGITPWITLPVAAVVTGAIGYSVVNFAARLKMDIVGLSILTFAIQLVITELANGLINVTGGVTGHQFSGLTIQPLVSGFGVSSTASLYYVILVVMGLVFVVYRRLMNSTYGLAFEMIRQDDDASESIGIDVVRYKSLAGFVSLFILGIIGPFFAQLQGFVSPSLFTFNSIDVLVLIMLILGGVRTMYGPLLGAIIIVLINQILSTASEYQTAIYGLLLMVLFLYFRSGIIPWARTILTERLGLDWAAPSSTGR